MKLLIAFLLIFPAWGQTPYAAWGDSLTEGGQECDSISYPSVLQSNTGIAVYNGGVAGQTSTQIATRMLADTSAYGSTAIFWEGRNNYNQQSQILTDIASQVAALTSSPKKYLVMSIINCACPDDEWSSYPNYNTILAVNAALQSTYPSNYLDIRKVLVNNWNASNTEDQIDHTNDVPPSTLRAHYTGGTLTNSIASSGVTNFVFSGTSFCNGAAFSGTNVLVIDAEYIYVETYTGTGPWTITAAVRGYAGSTAASHSAGATVTAIDATHLNALGYALVANTVQSWFAGGVGVGSSGSGNITVSGGAIIK